MSFNKQELRQRAETRVFSEFRKATGATVTAEELIVKNNQTLLFESQRSTEFEFDIFLSHSSEDAETVLGILEKLEGYGYRVYIDWINDSSLDKRYVNQKNIDILRARMRQSKCLLFATTESYYKSVWMPWELGFMDGEKGLAAILPLFDKPETASDNYKGQEYLGSYPYCVEAQGQTTTKNFLWICETHDTYIRFDKWLNGDKPYSRK